MDRWRFGRVIRALRQRHGWRQVDLAARAGVSRSVVGRIERGELNRIAWGDLVAVAEAVGARLDLDARWQGDGIDRLLDERHAATVNATVELLKKDAWNADVEVSFAIAGERGSIDIVGRHPPTGMLATFEIKATLGDANQTVIGVDRKTRLAPRIAAERGWSCRGVARFLVIADGSTARDRVRRHAALFDAAFPDSGAACRDWLRNPVERPASGIMFIAVRNVRRTGLTRARVRRPSVSPRPSSAAVRTVVP
jgi:transcriptional regulator with XRE-family HTH domain